MKTMKCPKCKGLGGYPKCGECQNRLVVNETTSSGSERRLVLRGCDEAPGRLGQTKLDWIRRMYGVPAKRGMRIYYGSPPNGSTNGTITGARDGRLLIRLDGWPRRRRPLAFHPTWNIHYPENVQGDSVG